jgi:hypothetical protein
MKELLGSKEKLTKNLSSKQIITILNLLLNTTAAPLFEHCSLMRQLILQAMLQTQLDHRRKISVHSKENTAGLIIYAIVNRDFTALKLCELDRGVLFKATDMVYNLLLQALPLEQALLKRPKNITLINQQIALARQIGVSINLLTPLARWTGLYYKLYLQFKEQVLAKYIKFAWQEANRARALTGLYVDINELFKNYLLAYSRAIDKCDANQGTLTHYIQQWMMSARSSPEHSHQYGEAYTLPSNIRKNMEVHNVQLTNMSVGIEDSHANIADPNTNISTSIDTVLLACLREIPRMRIAYLLLNLPINLKPKEIKQLQQA